MMVEDGCLASPPGEQEYCKSFMNGLFSKGLHAVILQYAALAVSVSSEFVQMYGTVPNEVRE